jgi:hypothetical protein
LPTATSTPTETPFGYFETHTPIPPTATVHAVGETPDPAEGASNEFGDYTCKLISKSPQNWAVIPTRTMWKVSWTLLNTGPKIWDDNVAIVWVEGTRLGVEKRYHFVKDVKAGEDVRAVITILTPKETGNYRSVWGLRSVKTNLLFCTFTIKITVQ